jgi:hypothetical protein
MKLIEVYCICDFSGLPQIAYRSMEALEEAIENPLQEFVPSDGGLSSTPAYVFHKWERENPSWILNWSTGHVENTRNFCVRSFLLPENKVDFFIKLNKGE